MAARVVPMLLTVGVLTVGQGGTAQAEDAVDGARTAGDTLFPHVGNGGYDALHYDLDLDVDTSWSSGTYSTSSLRATSTMTATTTGAPLKSFSLDFEGLSIDSVRVNGKAAAWTRDVDADVIKYKLVITPAQAVSGTFTVTVKYHGTPTKHVDADGSWEGWVDTTDGVIFMGQPIGSMTGYPHNNTPGDKATYDTSIQIPTTITSSTGAGTAAAISNGELQSQTVSEDGLRTTWVWKQDKPQASELTLIDIGKFDVNHSTITLDDGRELPQWSFVDAAQSTNNKTTFANRVAQLGPIIDRLEKIFGDYPGNSTGIVQDTVPSGISYALETQDRSFFPSVSSLNGNTLIHELAHQWFGDNVSPKTWQDIWINEGMATWGPTYYTNVLAAGTPNPAAVEASYFNSWNNKASDSPDWEIAPAGMTDSATLYDYQTYTRGAQFWEALRTAIGDTAFFDVVKGWQATYGGKSAGADELKALAEKESGHDLDAFFQDWIHEAGKPAWPQKLNLKLESVPATGAVEPGGPIDYTLTATNTGKVAMNSTTAEVDLADVLDDADLDGSTLPEGLVLDGTKLTWTVPATAVAGTAAAAFTVVVDDDASAATLEATASVVTLGGTCTACATSNTVGIQPIPQSSAPVVDGTPVVGGELAARTGGWSTGTTFTYRWSVGDAEVDGADAPTYSPAPGDVGKTVSVEVTGSKDPYSSVTLGSEAVGPVVTVAFTDAPVPTIVGSATYGSVLTAVPGPWNPSAELSYQWFRGASAIAGATGATYLPSLADIGTPIRVAVTGIRPGYTTTTSTSAPTSAVAKRALLGRVGIDGSRKAGKTVRARLSGFGSGVTVKYAWYVGGKKAGTKAKLTLTKKMAGRSIKVKATVRKAGHSTKTVTSTTKKISKKK